MLLAWLWMVIEQLQYFETKNWYAFILPYLLSNLYACSRSMSQKVLKS